MIVKLQAAFRGLLVRRIMRQKYGFICRATKSRNTKVSPEQRALNIKVVQGILKKLGPLNYDLAPELKSTIFLETKELIEYPDCSKYQGQWNTKT